MGDPVFLKWHRLLSRSDGLDNDVIEIRLRQQREAIVRCRRKSARLSPGSHAAHEHTIILRIDHRGAVAQQRAFSDYAGVVRQNRDSVFWIGMKEPQDEVVD